MKTKLLALCLFTLAACGSDNTTNNNTGNDNDTGSGACTASNAQTVSAITIQNFAYSPDCVKVAKGASVTFTNIDAVPHTATTKPGSNSAETFDSGNLAQNAQYAHTFTAAGTDVVWCSLHTTSMGTATFIVQ